jgi:hypothetical protein
MTWDWIGKILKVEYVGLGAGDQTKTPNKAKPTPNCKKLLSLFFTRQNSAERSKVKEKPIC